MIVVLMFAIPLGLMFLWLAFQQSSENRRPTVRYPDVLLRDTPKYVPPQEVADQYYSHVRRREVSGNQPDRQPGSSNISASDVSDSEFETANR